VAESLPSLRRVVGEEGLIQITPLMAAEDFSFFAREAPGLYFQLGVNAPDGDCTHRAPLLRL
jgi:amidohydrolase